MLLRTSTSSWVVSGAPLGALCPLAAGLVGHWAALADAGGSLNASGAIAKPSVSSFFSEDWGHLETLRGPSAASRGLSEVLVGVNPVHSEDLAVSFSNNLKRVNGS